MASSVMAWGNDIDPGVGTRGLKINCVVVFISETGKSKNIMNKDEIKALVREITTGV